jgi:pyruvate/2-oxoglutarate dehydrogenase complex dihydrolipoamide acyltransferase (E2) component
MPVKVLMPQLGESVTEGTISKWLKGVGDEIKEFEPLLEINTDKVDSEIASPGEGTLLAILADEGSVVSVGTILAWIGSEGESIPDHGSDFPARVEIHESHPELIPTQREQDTLPTLPPKYGRDKELGFISPVVAKISKEKNIDLNQVVGTGQGGRITKKDVLNYLDLTESGDQDRYKLPHTLTESQSTGAIPGDFIPHSIVRRSIADHMVKSKQISPHVSTVMEADLHNVVSHRMEHKQGFARDGVNLTFTAYFISAAIAGLKSYPLVNSTWMKDGIQIHQQINFGMATSLGEQGLIVPVIKNADQLSLLGLAQKINDLAIRARNNTLLPDEVQGGTFTITNHGTSGSLFATPIISQPQAAILGVGVIQKRVTVINDAIAIRPMVYLTLTFDHRILDGAIADHFLSTVVESLENWN